MMFEYEVMEDRILRWARKHATKKPRTLQAFWGAIRPETPGETIALALAWRNLTEPMTGDWLRYVDTWGKKDRYILQSGGPPTPQTG
jgi:hypothetical protein